MAAQESDGRVRLAEVLGALSLATDLGMGQPLGHAIRCCMIATGLAEELGLPAAARSEVFQVALLRYIGCTADAFEVAQVAGDEVALAVAVAPFVMGEPEQERQAAGTGDVTEARAAAMRAHCEAAGLLAARLRLGAGTVGALRHSFERWDGAGYPAGLSGTEIPQAIRIAVVARDVELWARRGGMTVALDVTRVRRGNAYDPTVVDAFRAVGESLLRVADAGWPAMLAAEPAPTLIPVQRLDGMLEVLADFADAKLPAALGHSRSVARLAEGAAGELGLGPAAVTQARRAGLVQDLGRVAVSNRVWETPGPLSWEAQEKVHLHPYLSEQVLLRTPTLRPLAGLAGAHHERLDVSGYYWIQQVMDVDQARQAVEREADVIVAQGGEAGGHSGFVGTMTLVPQVVDVAAGTPVVAAGGIAPVEDSRPRSLLGPMAWRWAPDFSPRGKCRSVRRGRT